MSLKGGHIVVMLAAAFVLAASCDRPRVIPADDMVVLYADMFLADQWLRDHPKEREAADTTLFFDPIFHKHGYTFEDYDASVRHYVRDPEKFGEIMERVKELLREQTDIRQSIWERKVDLAYRRVDFFSDSLWSRDWLTWTAPVIDTTVSLVVVPDSADVEPAAPADSLSPKTVPLKLELQ